MSRWVDAGHTLKDAVAGPRFHPTDGIIYAEVRFGTAWSFAVLDSLRARGFRVEARDEAPYFARLHAIRYDARDRRYIGVADPRWSGTAAGPGRSAGESPRPRGRTR